MKTSTLITSAVYKEWPDDLRSWFEECHVVKWAMDAVQIVTRQSASCSFGRFEEFSPQRLLTLLTYCYAVGIYDSESIEWAAENDEAARYICGGTIPDWQVICRFRKTRRPRVEQCLGYLLKQAAS